MKKISFTLLFFVNVIWVSAQSEQTLQIRSFRSQQEPQWIQDYLSLLSIPNTAADTLHLRENADFIMQQMRAKKISNVQLLQPDTKGAAPSIYGEIITPGAKQTLVFYAHYDGQPVDSTQWTKGTHPFTPMISFPMGDQLVIRKYSDAPKPLPMDWRIIARSASDDKAGVMAILWAYEAIQKSGYTLNYNIKFFFEGEEEAGSPHLNEIFRKYTSLLNADLWIICDGPVHQSGKKMISFGVRGDAHVEITTYGPYRPLHSGHYGNWAPNPGLLMAKLLSSMKDDNGKVTIRGFYDDVTPLTPEEKTALAAIPPVADQMKKELKFIAEEMPGVSLNDAIMLPSLNINGMLSGGVGAKAANVIPVTASAVLDLRLVPGNDYQTQQQRVVDHIKGQGFHVVTGEPTDAERMRHAKIARVKLSDGYNAQRTPMNLPEVRKVISAVQSTTAEQVVLVPTMGGSLPLFLFEKYLNAKTITVPIANHDNNQHAENENIRMQNLWNGVETMAAIMRMK